jgi:hypothetical protein
VKRCTIGIFRIRADALNITGAATAAAGWLRAFSKIVEKFSADVEHRQTDNENNRESIHFCSFKNR